MIMFRTLLAVPALLLAALLAATPAAADRIKDLGGFQGIRSNQLTGYGVVVGLPGTGDDNLEYTVQSLKAVASRFGLQLPPGANPTHPPTEPDSDGPPDWPPHPKTAALQHRSRSPMHRDSQDHPPTANPTPRCRREPARHQPTPPPHPTSTHPHPHPTTHTVGGDGVMTAWPSSW